jgi:hypothetical protein
MRTALVPKEHGAYGQMAFPLLTGLAVAGASTAALLTALAIVAGFFAHEPALVLLGLRGARARRDHGRRAARWLALEGTLALVAGVVALGLAPPDILWSFALPLVPGALTVMAIALGQEKSWHAEIAVALTFSFAAVPLVLVSGSTPSTAFAVAIPFAFIFAAGTLAVRTVILRVRGGGNARATAMTRAAALILATSALTLLALAAAFDLLAWTIWAATVPGLVLAMAVALSVPSPARLKAIGWSLVAASTVAAVGLVVSL